MLTLALVTLLAGCTTSVAPIEPAPTFAPRPAAEPIDPVVQYAHDRLATMTLREKILSMLMIHVPGTNAADRAGLARSGIGGFILMRDNIPASLSALASQTAESSPESGLPVLIATDQEGGIVRRVPADSSPSAAELRTLPPRATFEAFSQRGDLLTTVGVNVNFGVVADVARDPASFIYERSFGATGADAGARVAEAVKGESPVLSTLKHFPGHGAAPGDSHYSVPSTTMTFEDWRTSHALPFEAGIDAGATFVMFGHLAYTSVDAEPATFSHRWHEILRDDLAFDGIVITDDMGMLERSGVAAYEDQITNAVRAIAAGNTMLLYVGNVDIAGVVAAVTQAIDAGTLDEALIDDAALALLETRRRLSGETGRFVHCSAECTELLS